MSPHDLEREVREAVEILHGEFRRDFLRASFYTDFRPFEDANDRERVRGELEDDAEAYLRDGEDYFPEGECPYSEEVIREAAKRYAADELESWDKADGDNVYHADAWPG